MKVLLIEPPKARASIGGEDVFIFEPLALEYLAAGLANAHEARIVDMRLEENLARPFAEFRPDIVGITAYTSHVNVVRRLFEQIKTCYPAVLTVVGGHHATVRPEDFISPYIDLVVRGEGVEPLREIVNRAGNGGGFTDIPGVLVAADGKLVGPDAQAPIDLDALPFPDRTLTAPYRKHYYSEWMKPLASIRTSKGCPYRCRFCAEWKVAGGRYHRRDPRRVVEELAQIEEECVFFADDESLVDAPRMAELARLIGEAGIRKRYFLYGRSDTIVRNPKLLELWRAAGLERVFVGLEFVRDRDLEYINKRSTAEENRQAIRILQSLGIDIYASFIVRPEFTREDFAALRSYCRELGLNFASYAVLTPLPGTDLFDEVKDQLAGYDYDHVDFLHTHLPTTLPLRDFYREYRRLYTNGVPVHRQLALLRRYPLRDIPGLIRKGRQFYRRLENAYLDYGN